MAIRSVDIAVVGAGAAGLMAAIQAGRAARGSGRALRVVTVDGARTLGAKILVAGGGRCNVTHDVVDEAAFAGSSRNAVRKVLQRFDVPQTVSFFSDLGVQLKREDTGKLFPITDDARTILNALLSAARDAGVDIVHPWRVQRIERMGAAREAQPHSFIVESSDQDPIRAGRVILATGGCSLPKTGSDGHGYAIARSLGHSITRRVFPALVPLTLPKDHFVCGLSGLSAVATLEVRGGGGKRIAGTSFTDSMLCTHFGVSGPAVLDVSRYFINARHDDPDAHLIINWLPNESIQSVDAAMLSLGKTSPGRWLRERGLPQRLAEALCIAAGVEPSEPAHRLTREQRRALAAAVATMRLPITGDRGFTHAEVTAGGVPLSEIKLDTMESRITPGLHLCGEICDVDGRIGGYNFQWAWASGFVAGTAAARCA